MARLVAHSRMLMDRDFGAPLGTGYKVERLSDETFFYERERVDYIADFHMEGPFATEQTDPLLPEGFQFGPATVEFRTELSDLADFQFDAGEITRGEFVAARTFVDLLGSVANEIVGSRRSDTLIGNSANDAIRGGEGGDFIVAAGGKDTIRGGSGIDRIQAGAGADTVTGDRGHDVIHGGGGKDTIHGGKGEDRLTGGAGADIFAFHRIEDSQRGWGFDTITDFSRVEGDVIDLAAIDANAIADGRQSFNFIGKLEFSKVAGELRFVQQSGRTKVLADVDGDGTADFDVRVKGSLALTIEDFIL